MARIKDVESLSRQATDKLRDENMGEGLSSLYQDEQGQMVDVSRLTIKPGRPWWWRLIFWLLFVAAAVVAGWLAYDKWGFGANVTDVEVKIEAEAVADSGKFLTYTVSIKNNSNVDLKQGALELKYPDNFVLDRLDPAASQNNNAWAIDVLPRGQERRIVVSGRLFGLAGESQALTADFRYQAGGFSTEFKKTGVAETTIGASALNIEVVKTSSALVGEMQEVIVRYASQPGANVNNFRLKIDSPNMTNMELIRDDYPDGSVKITEPWTWQVLGVTEQVKELRLRFRFLDKLAEREALRFRFDYWLPVDPQLAIWQPQAVTSTASSSDSRLGEPVLDPQQLAASSTPGLNQAGDRYLPLVEKNLDIQVVKNDLNLILVMNGSDKDQAVDFGQTLNYSITYENKGESPLEDVVVMAVLDGDLLDWKTLSDKQVGEISGNTITWDKRQIPELSRINKGDKGSIDFKLRVKGREALSADFKQLVTASARFETRQAGDLSGLIANINRRQAAAEAQDLGLAASSSEAMASSSNNISNIIISKINSDLSVEASLLYFDADNNPLGSGPLPLEVGKSTSLRAFWRLSNSLHGLSGLQVAVNLPAYVRVGAKQAASVGGLTYDAAANRLVWNIAKLDKGRTDAQAEFSLDITPLAEHKNQLLVLLPKAELTATDDDNGAMIRKETKSKSSKLEDDEIIRELHMDINGGLVK